MERLKTMLAEAERQRRTVSDRLNMLKNWRQSLSGYSDGVRALLRAPASKITGLVGPLPQLGVAPAGMEAALEAALGQYLQSVVVETIDDAYTGLRYLQSASQGKALVVWLCDGRKESEFADIVEEQLHAGEELLNNFLAGQAVLREKVSGFAWRYIQCDARYFSLFRRILDGIVIVKDVKAAQTLLAWMMFALQIF